MTTATVQRSSSHYDPLTRLSEPFLVPLSSRRYNRQFSTLYDYRLRRLKHPKGRLVKKATEQWWEGKGASSALMRDSSQSSSQGSLEIKANYVKRILDVKQGQICFVIGIVYCSMHLKPDVLEELTREVSREVLNRVLNRRGILIFLPTAAISSTTTCKREVRRPRERRVLHRR
jgi:hypothetical protein